jgi:NitT/TauT family transport system permease protein
MIHLVVTDNDVLVDNSSPAPLAGPKATPKAARSGSRSRLVLVNVVRLVIVVAIIAAWQGLPLIPALQNVAPVFNSFFVSSPTRVLHEMDQLAIGSRETGSIWPYLGATFAASMIGTLSGAVLGLLVALWLSMNDFASRVASPFISVINAIPRVAIIPVVVIIVGPTPVASAITAVTIVFFVVFFNAFEGSRSIPRETLNNARLLGANGLSSMWRVRFPYAAAWTFASLPNAISFGLVGSVTAEILSGAQGVGKLMLTATNTSNSDLTFAVVVYVGALGVILVLLSAFARRRLLHWWDIDPE